MLTLYNAAHSTCSQKVRICLAEKGLAFEDIRLDLGRKKEHPTPEYLKINPNGVVGIPAACAGHPPWDIASSQGGRRQIRDRRWRAQDRQAA